MNEFITYKQFEDEIDAEEFIQLLKENSILYEVEKAELKFRLLEEPLDNTVTVKVQPEDFKKVEQLQDKYDTEVMAENSDHYLYTFSDKDIIAILVSPSKWKSLEVKIAKKIANERGIQVTANDIQTIRDKEKSQAQHSKTSKTNFIQNGASWLFLIGILSLLNLITFIFQFDFQFIFGLTINYLIIELSSELPTLIHLDTIYISITIGVLIAILFIGLGRKSKQENSNAYFIGLLLYSADTIITLLIKNWLSLAFHIFALIIIIAGYATLHNKKSET